MDLTDFQTTFGAWFDTAVSPTTTPEQHGLKVCEESGELARAIGCRSAGVRGTDVYWDAETRKEAADVVLAVLALAHRERFSLATAVTARHAELRGRDWAAHRTPGLG